MSAARRIILIAYLLVLCIIFLYLPWRIDGLSHSMLYPESPFYLTKYAPLWHKPAGNAISVAYGRVVIEVIIVSLVAGTAWLVAKKS